MKKRRCKSVVIDKTTKKKRRCRKKSINGESTCSIHKILSTPRVIKDRYIDSYSETVYGQCCFCKSLCNPASQSCGRCARIVSWYGTDYLNY